MPSHRQRGNVLQRYKNCQKASDTACAKKWGAQTALVATELLFGKNTTCLCSRPPAECSFCCSCLACLWQPFQPLALPPSQPHHSQSQGLSGCLRLPLITPGRWPLVTRPQFARHSAPIGIHGWPGNQVNLSKASFTRGGSFGAEKLEGHCSVS